MKFLWNPKWNVYMFWTRKPIPPKRLEAIKQGKAWIKAKDHKGKELKVEPAGSGEGEKPELRDGFGEQ